MPKFLSQWNQCRAQRKVLVRVPFLWALLEMLGYLSLAVFVIVHTHNPFVATPLILFLLLGYPFPTPLSRIVFFRLGYRGATFWQDFLLELKRSAFFWIIDFVFVVSLFSFIIAALIYA